MFRSITDSLRKYFLAGALVVVPLILTFLVLGFMFDTIDGILSPYLTDVLGYSVPGLGIFFTFLIIILAGALTRSFIGVAIFRGGDKILRSFPVVRVVYLAAKQLVAGVAQPQKRAFKEVVLIEYPRKGIYAIAFAINSPTLHTPDGETSLLTVFIPSTPTPISGMVVMVKPSEALHLDLTVEEAFKFLVSGGIVSPDHLRGRILPPLGERSSVEGD